MLLTELDQTKTKRELHKLVFQNSPVSLKNNTNNNSVHFLLSISLVQKKILISSEEPKIPITIFINISPKTQYCFQSLTPHSQIKIWCLLITIYLSSTNLTFKVPQEILKLFFYLKKSKQYEYDVWKEVSNNNINMMIKRKGNRKWKHYLQLVDSANFQNVG
jgi:hypothetical protein